MKLISLNIWGGKLWDDLAAFLERHSIDTDIFCFQEVTSCPEHREVAALGMAGNPHISDLYEQLQEVLPDYVGYFGCELRNMSGSGIDYGSGLFIRKGVPHEYHAAFVYGAEEDRSQGKKAFELSSRIMQTTVLNSQLAVHHLHGVWALKDKSDVLGRIEQSEKINGIMASYSIPQVLCGDLNLNPSNESLRLLTQGRRNLIEEYGIGTTRPHHTSESGTGYCDYAIATPEVNIINFEVLPDVVSDHLALSLEFSA